MSDVIQELSGLQKILDKVSELSETLPTSLEKQLPQTDSFDTEFSADDMAEILVLAQNTSLSEQMVRLDKNDWAVSDGGTRLGLVQIAYGDKEPTHKAPILSKAVEYHLEAVDTQQEGANKHHKIITISFSEPNNPTHSTTPSEKPKFATVPNETRLEDNSLVVVLEPIPQADEVVAPPAFNVDLNDEENEDIHFSDDIDPQPFIDAELETQPLPEPIQIEFPDNPHNVTAVGPAPKPIAAPSTAEASEPNLFHKILGLPGKIYNYMHPNASKPETSIVVEPSPPLNDPSDAPIMPPSLQPELPVVIDENDVSEPALSQPDTLSETLSDIDVPVPPQPDVTPTLPIENTTEVPAQTYHSWNILSLPRQLAGLPGQVFSAAKTWWTGPSSTQSDHAPSETPALNDEPNTNPQDPSIGWGTVIGDIYDRVNPHHVAHDIHEHWRAPESETPSDNLMRLIDQISPAHSENTSHATSDLQNLIAQISPLPSDKPSSSNLDALLAQISPAHNTESIDSDSVLQSDTLFTEFENATSSPSDSIFSSPIAPPPMMSSSLTDPVLNPIPDMV